MCQLGTALLCLGCLCCADLLGCSRIIIVDTMMQGRQHMTGQASSRLGDKIATTASAGLARHQQVKTAASLAGHIFHNTTQLFETKAAEQEELQTFREHWWHSTSRASRHVECLHALMHKYQ